MPTREKLCLSFRLALAKLVHSGATVRQKISTLVWEARGLLIKSSYRVDLKSHQGKPLEKNLGQEDNVGKQIYTQQAYNESPGCITRTAKDRGWYQ